MTLKNQKELSLELKKNILRRKEQKLNLKNNNTKLRKNKIGKSKLLP